MKNIITCALALCLATACTSPGSEQPHTSLSGRKDANEPANPANPYDAAGRMQDALLDAYYAAPPAYADAGKVAERINALTGELPEASKASAAEGFTGIAGSDIDQALGAQNAAGIAANAAGLSAPAKNALAAISGKVLDYLAAGDPDGAMDALYDFEDATAANADFSEADRRTLLTSGSVMRYSVARKKKRAKKNTDPDWNIFIANFSGGAAGADRGTCQAAAGAAAAGIMQNRN